MSTLNTIGFIGVGVMGEPICRHLATKSGARVIATDRDNAPLERLAQHNVSAVSAGNHRRAGGHHFHVAALGRDCPKRRHGQWRRTEGFARLVPSWTTDC